MPNKESSQNNADESKEQSEQSWSLAAAQEILRNGLNSTKKYIARTGDQGLTSLNEASARNPDFIISKRNEELGNKVSVFYGYTIGNARFLNGTEKLELNSKYSTAGNPADNFRYVKFYANNTPCQAFPNISKFPEGTPQRLILENMYPEALVDLKKLQIEDIPPGQIIKIEYLDKKNNLLPVVVELSGDASGVLIDLEKPIGDSFIWQFPGAPAVTVKSLFSEGQIRDIINKGQLPGEDKFGGKDRELENIKHFVIHDSVLGTTGDMISYLKSKGLGIHYIISKDGSIVTTGDWKERLGHAGDYYNATSIGVEVVNPTYVSNPYNDSTWDNSFISPAPWAFSPDIRKTNKFIIPTRNQMESTWALCLIVTASPEMNIPLEFVGLEKEKNRFVITGANPYKKLKRSKAGILAHSYIKHGDGAAATLYCYLRSTGLPPDEAWSKMNFLLKPKNLIPEKTTGLKKDGKTKYEYIQYYANLNLLKKGNV
jgi:hypothetical protein